MAKQTSLTRLAIAWTLMWALLHFVTAFAAPWISVGTDPAVISVVYIGLSISLILALCYLYDSHPYWRIVAKVILFVNGVLQVVSTVGTWTGQTQLNIPYPNIEIFQVSMALMEAVSAVFMFYLALPEPD